MSASETSEADTGASESTASAAESTDGISPRIVTALTAHNCRAQARERGEARGMVPRQETD